MNPMNPTTSPVPPLLLLLSFVLVLRYFPSFQPSHEPPLTLTFRTPTSSYRTATSRNPFQTRCALLLCSSHTPPQTTCDHLHLTQISTNRSTRLCVLDFLASNWDALSRTYNDGIFHVSPTIHLRFPPEFLPTHAKRVHFPYERALPDMSPAWFALVPSNATRDVIKQWAKVAEKLPPKTQAPDHVALNRVRDCRAEDVMCHLRASSIKTSCDGLFNVERCTQKAPGAPWMRAFLIALAILFTLRMFVSTVGALLPRNRTAKLRSLTGLDVGVGTKLVAIGLATLFAGGVLLAAVRWSVAVTVLARMMAVKAVRRFDVQRVEGVSFGGEVDGGWRSHAFIIADGLERVAVSGPGAGFVVWLFGSVRWIAIAVEDGLLVWCFAFLVAFKMFLEALVAVAGVGGRKRINEEDEYADRREAFMFRRKEKGRSFILSRERGKIQGV